MSTKLPYIFTKRWPKIVAALLLSCILVLIASRLHPIGQADRNLPLDTFTSNIEERVSELATTYRIPGVSIALVKNGGLVWSQAFGFADIDAKRKMTTDTVCRVQSISKSLTAWGVMNLVEQGVVSLDDPVSNYLFSWRLPSSDYPEEEVTVRQLLSHTAGMPLGDILTRYAPGENMPSLREKLTKEAYLFQQPGESFSYSNTGYNLLELLIEEVTGLSFAHYMEQEILTPLGMTHSSFEWSEAFEPPVPTGYNLTGEEIPVYVYPEKASGGLFATAEDIAEFTSASMYNRTSVIDDESIRLLYSPAVRKLGMYSLVFDAYGLGHYIENLGTGQLAVSHGGQGTGWMTHFHAVPETGDAIVILTNSQRSWPFIAYILSDWTEWNGFSQVGMGAILIGQRVLWGLIGLILFLVFLLLFEFAGGLMSKKRRFSPFSKDFRIMRSVQFGLSIIFIMVIIWCLCQPYLNITSIFPRASVWLGFSVFSLGLALLLSSLFPLFKENSAC